MIFKICAFVILFLFYLTYFLKMFFQKRKGIKTDQMGKNKSGLPLYVEIILKISTVLMPILQVLSIFLVNEYLNINIRCVGILIGVIGILFFVLSITQMKDSWRAGVNKDEKTVLVDSGIYRYSRNPAFVGFDLTYLGILLMFFNRYLFFMSIFTVFMFHLQIVNVEEPFLLEVFDKEYIEYCKKVNRYIGRKA